MWCEPDAASREEAAKLTLPVANESTRLLAAVQQATGDTADFFVKVATVVVLAVAQDRRGLAKALIALNPAPASLQSIAQQNSGPSSWWDVTGEVNVKWAVHSGDEAEPKYDLAIVQGDNYQYVKSSLYGTIVMRMVMDACEAVSQELPPAEQKLGFQAVCLQVNTALREQGNLARLLLTESAKRPWKFDLDPYTATQNYGGKRRRLTAQQQATAKAEGRSQRVLMR